jgi:hypothetical protein
LNPGININLFLAVAALGIAMVATVAKAVLSPRMGAHWLGYIGGARRAAQPNGKRQKRVRTTTHWQRTL